MNNYTKRPGYFLPLVLTFAVIVFIVTTAILSLAFTNFGVVKRQAEYTSAVNIAEAGVNYYLWHLAHSPNDYCDGAACSGGGPFGPYVHSYKDADGNTIGEFKLTITPPAAGSNRVTVRSEGSTNASEKRTIVADLGVPSFAQYGFVTNSEVWFGENEETRGQVHSNRGIHYDGTAYGLVTSAVESYVPTSCFGGDGTTKPGIWGTGGPEGSWQYPVPPVDFNAITTDLSTLEAEAQSDGIHLPTLVDNRGRKTYSGYALELLPDSTLRVGRVTSKRDDGGLGGSCSNHSRYNSLIQSISWEPTSRSLPNNGIIFVSDNLWIWGTVTDRLTVVSGRLPDTNSTNTSIFLQNDITYSAKNGSVALGLISQSDIVVNSDSEESLSIDAFLLSQKGRVFRPYYQGNVKLSLDIYGGIGSNSWWTWSWVDGAGTVTSGYQNTSQTYDPYLTLSPPPLFPKTGSYAVLSWKEEPIL